MKLVAIESPYAATNPAMLTFHKAYLRACLRDSVLRGEAPYASHAYLCDALDDRYSSERHMGLAVGAAWTSRADLRAFYIDLGMSNGMRLALAAYRSSGVSFVLRRLSGNDKWITVYTMLTSPMLTSPMEPISEDCDD